MNGDRALADGLEICVEIFVDAVHEADLEAVGGLLRASRRGAGARVEHEEGEQYREVKLAHLAVDHVGSAASRVGITRDDGRQE